MGEQDSAEVRPSNGASWPSHVLTTCLFFVFFLMFEDKSWEGMACEGLIPANKHIQPTLTFPTTHKRRDGPVVGPVVFTSRQRA